MRLVTRADFDGLACGALITRMEKIDSYLFVEPKFMQDGMVEVRQGDIIANLPYHPQCALWFDHHITNSESWRKLIGVSSFESQVPTLVPGKGGFRLAHSAARVVYEYYTSESLLKDVETRPTDAENPRFLRSERIRSLMDETDKIDAALLSPEEVLHPTGYVLISMTIDGKWVEDEPYWRRLIDLLRDAPLETIMQDPEVAQRCQDILDSQEILKGILLKRTTLKGNVIFTDLRGIKEVPDGNRFLIYTLFRDGNISVKIAYDNQRPNTTAISVGYNIFNSTSKVNVGALMERHGGGGHKVVGSCRVPNDQADKAVEEILKAIRED